MWLHGLEIKIDQIKQKNSNEEIKDFLESLDLNADREENEDRAELMRGMCDLLTYLFPDCTPWTKNY